MLESPRKRAARPALKAALSARVLRHDLSTAMTTLFFEDGELRAPLITDPIGSGVIVTIYARDVSIALSRPMDVSITNRLPGEIVDISHLDPPYVRVTFSLGATRLHALVTSESVERLALVPGLRAWVMIKAVAISRRDLKPDRAPQPRPWPLDQNSSPGKP
ncbi:Molybdate transport system ATP-binding protein [Methylocella tundrae]|uniref:Molybdate transport system ATP-binding protein n=1 Tax=Methylocella tundrae TaxID=227605 RepID=A0A8B6MAV0_METTU|nr:TOBE domain-containing protein [Methylocella tundrae]VTZ24811.1 Molybdate transport system ATP-binding protein [Methylocella tundrae]VTZ52157.1 Molybdate transport system ATP-binding protein [Methylocella tundrae]